MNGLLYKINKAVLFKISVMLAFSGFFLVVSFNGKAKLYIHPKLVYMLVLCAVVFIAISFVLLKDLFKDGRKAKIKFSMITFLFPLLMALIIPAKPITNNFSMYNFGNQVSQGSSETSVDNENAMKKQSNQASNTDSINEEESVCEKGNGELQLKNNRIVLDDNNFIRYMDKIYNNLSKYDGKEIEFTGFIFKEKSFKKDEFVAARVLMACCAADTQVIGFLCKYKKAGFLKKDCWYKFSGKIVKDTYEGKERPVIKIENMVSTSKSRNEYLYPY